MKAFLQRSHLVQMSWAKICSNRPLEPSGKNPKRPLSRPKYGQLLSNNNHNRMCWHVVYSAPAAETFRVFSMAQIRRAESSNNCNFTKMMDEGQLGWLCQTRKDFWRIPRRAGRCTDIQRIRIAQSQIFNQASISSHQSQAAGTILTVHFLQFEISTSSSIYLG